MTQTVTAGAVQAPALGPLTARARRAALLTAIRSIGGAWHTARVQALYRRAGIAVPLRATARHDLQHLARNGWLICHDTANDRTYSFNPRKDTV